MPERARKTYPVHALLSMVNHRLSLSDEAFDFLVKDLTPAQAYRKALAHLIEPVLHESNRYKGFNYLEAMTPGFSGENIEDQSRRVYF